MTSVSLSNAKYKVNVFGYCLPLGIRARRVLFEPGQVPRGIDGRAGATACRDNLRLAVFVEEKDEDNI